MPHACRIKTLNIVLFAFNRKYYTTYQDLFLFSASGAGVTLLKMSSISLSTVSLILAKVEALKLAAASVLSARLALFFGAGAGPAVDS